VSARCAAAGGGHPDENSVRERGLAAERLQNNGVICIEFRNSSVHVSDLMHESGVELK